MDQWDNDNQEGRTQGVNPQMADRFGTAPEPAFQELPAASGPNKTVLLVIAAAVGVLTLGVVTLAVVLFAVSGDDEDVAVQPAVTVVGERPAEDGMEFEISNDELKREVMDRTTKAGWGYTWKETRKNDFYEAWDLVLTRKTKRIGLTVYLSEKPAELQTIAGETESPDLAIPFKGNLLVFAPMPGQKMSNRVLTAFKDE